jgi:hypothetical protein
VIGAIDPFLDRVRDFGSQAYSVGAALKTCPDEFVSTLHVEPGMQVKYSSRVRAR